MVSFRPVDLRNFSDEASLFFTIARQWRNPLVFLDTEFPGTIYAPTKPYSTLSLAERYALLKINVDDLRLIQVGITLSHPSTEKKIAITWQFEIHDFDLRCHPFAPDSIHLLRSSGIVLERTRRLGIPSTWLAGLLVDAGLVGCRSRATCVAFQGCYDFAILFKSLLQMTVKLPATLDMFTTWARRLFDSKLYDLKCLAKRCRLHDGLEKVAMEVKAERAVGAKHQAGSDSRLACEVFLKIKETYFFGNGDDVGDEVKLPYEGVLSGF
ncbi:hypothetical protein KSP39_PZI021968 [Platanthera zijinensis]|uniref:Uncharacterized protein n=1 Tax=Platanthera zijinensis TaxID=2320716 RepID=A0AAP0AXU2_9ASPA